MAQMEFYHILRNNIIQFKPTSISFYTSCLLCNELITKISNVWSYFKPLVVSII